MAPLRFTEGLGTRRGSFALKGSTGINQIREPDCSFVENPWENLPFLCSNVVSFC